MIFTPQTHLSQILKWNQQIPPITDACVHDLVSVTAHQQPEALAEDAWDGRLTYERLTLYANQLASHLMTMGAKPETFVGLCMSKSKWGTVAMLAILQAGAAVVPLGIEHPLSRIHDILNDSASMIILVDQAQKERLAGLDINAIVIDDLLFGGLKKGTLHRIPALLYSPETLPGLCIPQGRQEPLRGYCSSILR